MANMSAAVGPSCMCDVDSSTIFKHSIFTVSLYFYLEPLTITMNPQFVYLLVGFQILLFLHYYQCSMHLCPYLPLHDALYIMDKKNILIIINQETWIHYAQKLVLKYYFWQKLNHKSPYIFYSNTMNKNNYIKLIKILNQIGSLF